VLAGEGKRIARATRKRLRFVVSCDGGPVIAECFGGAGVVLFEAVGAKAGCVNSAVS